MFNYAIHHALALVLPLADDLCHPTKPQKMCVSFSRLEGTPRLLQTLNGWIQTGTFFFLPLLIEKARTQVTGQRGGGVGVGLVAREEFTGEAKPMVLTGLCKRAWEQLALSQSHKQRAPMSDNALIHSRDEVERAAETGRAFVIVMEFCHGPIAMHRSTPGRVMMEGSSYGVFQHL